MHSKINKLMQQQDWHLNLIWISYAYKLRIVEWNACREGYGVTLWLRSGFVLVEIVRLQPTGQHRRYGLMWRVGGWIQVSGMIQGERHPLSVEGDRQVEDIDSMWMRKEGFEWGLLFEYSCMHKSLIVRQLVIIIGYFFRLKVWRIL